MSVEYSFVGDEKNETFSFQSKINTFGVDHVSSKDIKSFYVNFSKQAFFDTGLLPVDGSGLLSIRSAGSHTQIGYQHKPGMYYINWGGYEGDPNAEKIYVAQPYRIVIADIYNNNILGARTFYSPVPITYPDAPLYHVNLPNINCLGYRGNGVGWICLYHNEDISHYPFNEKVAKILDRCSGTEAYNDANMSETDGPRIYRKFNKPSYLHDPQEWQRHSAINDISWTLDPDLWIPVLVKSMDAQGCHDEEGIPLTYGMAVTGNYQAYYTDPLLVKPVNQLTREDMSIKDMTIFNWFRSAYNTSISMGHTNVNSFTAASKVRNDQSIAEPVFVVSDEDEDEDEEFGDTFECSYCDNLYYENKVENYTILHNNIVCGHCFDSGELIYVSHLDDHCLPNDPNLFFVEELDNFYYMPMWHEKVKCNSCKKEHPYDSENNLQITEIEYYQDKSLSDVFEDSIFYCYACAVENTTCECGKCSKPIPDIITNLKTFSLNVFNISSDTNELTSQIKFVCNSCYSMSDVHERNLDITSDSIRHCLCGDKVAVSEFIPVNKIYPNTLLKFLSTNLGSIWAINETIELSPHVDAAAEALKNKLLQELDKNTLIHSYTSFLASDIEDFKLIDFGPKNIYVITTHLCPMCVAALSLDSQSSATLMHTINNGFSKHIQEFLVPTMLNEESLMNLFGTSFNIAI